MKYIAILKGDVETRSGVFTLGNSIEEAYQEYKEMNDESIQYQDLYYYVIDKPKSFRIEIIEEI